MAGSVAIAMATQRWGENLLLVFSYLYSNVKSLQNTGESTDMDTKRGI